MSNRTQDSAQPQDRKRMVSPGRLTGDLGGLAGCFCALNEPRAVAKALTEYAGEQCGSTIAVVWLADETGGRLQLSPVAVKGRFPSALLGNCAQGETIVQRAFQRAVPQVLRWKGKGGDELAAWAREHRLSFIAAYPLMGQGATRGVLMIGAARPPSRRILAHLELAVRLGSLALRGASLLTSVRRAEKKLDFLAEASRALGSTLELPEVLARTLEVAKAQVEAERGTLFLVDERTQEIWSMIAHGLGKQEIRLPLGKGIAGHVAKTGEVVNIADAYADPRFNPEVDQRTGYHTRNILCLPIRNKAGKIIAALQLLNRKHGAFTNEDTDFLLTLSGHIAVALENAQLHQELLEKERMERELELAREIQCRLLPETTPLLGGFDIAVLNEPCYAVGGDYYDFIPLGPDKLLLVIADVEGKGVSSALVMSNLQATLHALVLHLSSLNEIATSLNRIILAHTKARKYLSIFLGLIDVGRKEIEYINCGHVPPILLGPSHKPLALVEGGTVIGLFEDAQYHAQRARLRRGDVLILCTDGITESMDAEDEEYGMERVARCAESVRARTAQEIVAAVNNDVLRFSRYGKHLDDKVMVVVKVD